MMMETHTPRELHGGCLCGAVRYRITGPLGRTGHCHCSICRRSHGAAFATWAAVDAQRFEWTAGAQFVQGHESSPGTLRCFCRRCGSPLVSSHDGRVGEVVLASVDGDPGVRATEHLFVASKAAWDEITDALPQHGTWPPDFQP